MTLDYLKGVQTRMEEQLRVLMDQELQLKGAIQLAKQLQSDEEAQGPQALPPGATGPKVDD